MAKRTVKGPAKLPAKQLAILAICRFAEPVALTSVFPYLPEMIESFGVAKEEVAKWAGITSAVFSLSQCLTAIVWGRASDMFGRKKTVLVGLTLTMFVTLLWGMSTSLPMAIVARALAGGCNGNVGIIRTMVAEMVPEKELQPRAFSIMPLVWTLGSIFGPSFGGFFAKPAENMPALFGNSRYLIKFPFALPNIVASMLFITGIITGILFLKETLETKRKQKDYGLILGQQLTRFVKTMIGRARGRGRSNSYRSVTDPYDESTSSLLRRSSNVSTPDFNESTAKAKVIVSKPSQPSPTLVEVFTRQSVINLIAYTFLALHSVAYDQLLPIFMHNPRQVPTPANTSLPLKFSGGFGLGSGRIGTIFTLYGVVGCFIQFLIFPPTARKFGVLNCFKGCAITFPLICFATPYTALIQTPAIQQITMFGIMVVKSFAVIFAFPCCIILLTNSATSLRILGTLNGFAVSISAVGRAAGPAMGGAAFTWGLEKGYVITPWWLLGSIAIIGAIPIWYLEEMPGFSKTDDESTSDDEDEEEVEEDETLLPVTTLPTVAEDPEERSILVGDEVFARDPNEEAIDTIDGPPLSKLRSRTAEAGRGSTSLEASRERMTSEQKMERRMSNPILVSSIGPGGGRRLSNSLAASNMGQGTGGTSFT